MKCLALAITALLVVAAPALADQAIAELPVDTPVAGYGGWKAWSAGDAGSGRYTLTLRAPDDTVKPAPLSPSSKPFDVSLGPDAHGDVVAIYRRCTSRGCDVNRLNLETGVEQRLRSVSSPSYSESSPAIWRSTVVFLRTVRGCEVPYVKDLRSSRPSRRLLKSKCLQTPAGQTAIRGTRIAVSSVDFTGTDENGAGRKVAEVRLYSAARSGSSVLLRQSFGEESNLFGQVALDARFAYTVRIGLHGPNTFVRVPFAGGARQEVRAFRVLTAAFAKPTDHESLYVEHQFTFAEDCSGFTLVPCRLVLSPAVPFGGVVRTLTPELTVAYEGTPRRGQPLTFTGRLTQQRVAGGEVVATGPLAAVPVELYHRIQAQPERFEPTGQRGVTDADGRYTITLPAVGADPFYTAIAETQPVRTWAGRGTVGSVTR